MNSKLEEWRDVVGFEGIYEVSSLGRVKRIAPSNSTYSGRILNPDFATGYARVSLHKNGKCHRLQIHRLVARAFLIGFEPNRHVNHKNGVKRDNRVENLEWVTPRQNVLHAWRLGLCKPVFGEAHSQAKLSDRDVRAIIALVANGTSSRVVANAFGVSESTVSQIILGKTRTYIHAVA